MNSELPIILKCRVNRITIEVCHGGEIPDIFRLLHFDPIKEFELPDTKITDYEFHRWIDRYLHASPCVAKQLLEEAKCN